MQMRVVILIVFMIFVACDTNKKNSENNFSSTEFTKIENSRARIFYFPGKAAIIIIRDTPYNFSKKDLTKFYNIIDLASLKTKNTKREEFFKNEQLIDILISGDIEKNKCGRDEFDIKSYKLYGAKPTEDDDLQNLYIIMENNRRKHKYSSKNHVAEAQCNEILLD
jgi:hypothetical protein